MFGSAAKEAPQTAVSIADLRRIISDQSPRQTREQPAFSTSLPNLDEALSGGLPRGKLLELQGGAGKMSFALLTLAAATRAGQLAAFIDAEDAFDAETAARAGVDLARLLWVRLPQAGERERGRDALRALDLLLAAGGFGLAVVYIDTVRSRLDVAWPRLVQRAERGGAAVLLCAEQPVAGSFAAATLRCAPGEAIWERVPGGRMLLRGRRLRIEVVRSRLGAPSGAEAVALRK